MSAAGCWADHQFFADHPARRYRLRPGWAVRRHGQTIFLRTPLPDASPLVDDGEAAAELVWWAHAWPDLAPPMRRRMAASARKSGGSR